MGWDRIGYIPRGRSNRTEQSSTAQLRIRRRAAQEIVSQQSAGGRKGKR